MLERLAVLDVEHGAPVDDITRAMTHLAEVTLDRALTAARAELDEIHGAPQTPEGGDLAFWVLGMGKLGARELNVSSDIDLIYVYEDDGATHGPRPVTAHEYFTHVAKRLYALIGDVTDDGQVFRARPRDDDADQAALAVDHDPAGGVRGDRSVELDRVVEHQRVGAFLAAGDSELGEVHVRHHVSRRFVRRPTRPDRPGSTRVSALTTWASGPTTTRARSRSIADTILRATAEGGRIT